MKFLSASKYLTQLSIIDETIRQDLERLSGFKMDIMCAGGIRYDKDNVQTSCTGDSLEKSVAKYIDFNEYINQEIDHYVNVKNKIIHQIRELRDASYIRVLYEVYVNGKSLKIVSVEMQKSYKTIREIHKKALIEFEKTHKNLTYINDYHLLPQEGNRSTV